VSNQKTTVRLIDTEDAAAIAAHRVRDMVAFTPWEPAQPTTFYTTEGQVERIEQLLQGYRDGTTWPGVVLADDVVIGQVTVGTILRQPFLRKGSVAVERVFSTARHAARPVPRQHPSAAAHWGRPMQSSRRSAVLVDQPTEHPSSPNQHVEVDHHARLMHRRTVLETLVRAVFIEVAHIVGQHLAGVAFVVEQQVIRALLPDAAHEPLRVAVRPRRTRRCLDHPHAFIDEHRVERERELRIAIPDQEPNEPVRSSKSKRAKTNVISLRDR
jgi:hypothetical protein